MTTICNLNNDCLIKIVEYLDVEDQVELRWATERGTRLHSSVGIAWRHSNVHNLDDRFCWWNCRPEQLNDYLASINETCKVLVISKFLLEEISPTYHFPNCHELHCSVECYEDEEILVKYFPSLTKLVLRGEADGLLIGNLTQLRELDLLSFLPELKDYLENICDNLINLKKLSLGDFLFEQDYAIANILKLKQLTELNWEQRWLTQLHIRKLLIGLPKLRKLWIPGQFENWFLEEIAKIRGHDVVTASFPEHQSVRTETLLRLPNLRTLKIFAEVDFRLTTSLGSTLTCLPRLENLDLIRGRDCYSFDTLWDIIAKVPHLKVLNVLLVDYEKSEFDKNSMERALQGRNEPISLRFFNVISPWDWAIKHLQHPNLEVSFDKGKNDFTYEKMMTTEFEPKH